MRPMSKLTIAVTQMTCGWDEDDNIQRAEAMVREAKGQGAGLVLLQELFLENYQFLKMCAHMYQHNWYSLLFLVFSIIHDTQGTILIWTHLSVAI